MTTQAERLISQGWDVPPGRIMVRTDRATVPKSLAAILDPRWQVQLVRREDYPKSFDFYTMTSGLTAQNERYAARAGALPVVLPEGGPWLARHLSIALEEGDVWIYPKEAQRG